jgi:ClpP class serine protease
MRPEDIQPAIDKYSDENDVDILAYFGPIARDYDERIIHLCRKRNKRSNILLVLSTLGGDPHAGYRIARCLQEAYQTIEANHGSPGPKNAPAKKGNYSVFIDGYCKSAGTLMCLGADKLIMSGNSELGPIDVQLRKREEVGERESGLTPLQAMQYLELQSVLMFQSHFAS